MPAGVLRALPFISVGKQHHEPIPSVPFRFARGDELIDVLASGQGVLNVLSLAGVKEEVDAQLVPLALDEADGSPAVAL